MQKPFNLNWKSLFILFFIVILGAALRFSFLTSNPPSLNWDEVSHGYNAYSILKTGMDQWGQKFPILNFRAYGDYPTTLNLYLTIPFIAIFGLTEFAIRFPHAIMGTLTIISVFFLTYGITKKKTISLLTALLVAVGPWYVFASRFVLQSNLSVFLLITAAAMFVNRDKCKCLLSLSFVSLFLTLFAYHTTRIFSPLIILGALAIYRKEISNKIIYFFVAVFLAFSTYILLNPGATARGNVLFIIDQGAINKIEQSRTNSKLPVIISKLLYNRPIYFAEKFVKNYIGYFSPNFLFLKGGTQYQFSVPNSGLIYPFGLPFFYIGLAILLYKSFSKNSNEEGNNYKLILLWLILSPIPASLTNESFTVIRATTMLPIPEILISIAVYEFAQKVFKKNSILLISVFILLMSLATGEYLLNYFTNYRTNYSWSWQYGYKEIANYIKLHYEDYDKIVITKKYGEPHEFLLFYLKWNPINFYEDKNKIAFFQSNWFWVDEFDKFSFVNDWQIPSGGYTFVLESGTVIRCLPSNTKCLLISSPDKNPVGWHKIDTVKFLNGDSAFDLFSNRI